MEAVVEPVSDPGRRVAPGGWRRAAVGVALGAVAGVLVALVVPRDEPRGPGNEAERRAGDVCRRHPRGPGNEV